MPSASPDLTTRYQLPSPKPADPPDVPGDVKALADRLDAVIPFMKNGMFSGQTNADGGITVTHGLGVAPAAAQMTVLASQASTEPSIGHLIATPAATTFAARVFRGGQPIRNENVSVYWTVIAP